MTPDTAADAGSGRSSATGSAACPPLYFCVLHGDNKTALFNITCQKEHLISAIRRSCKLDQNTVIELSTVGGQLLKLPELQDHESLSDQIGSRDVVVLCKLQASKHPSIEPLLIPLIDNLDDFPELKELTESVAQRVAEREAKLSPKQLAEIKRLQQQQQQQQRPSRSRYADKKIVLYNKVKPRPS
ncbi:hypothetical protein BOX15_Mlig001578g1 [Macrostomum lignano]|uniref:Uncharacterized protein n=3 Tax=Macrostomum lignano TaxID=282301 RepID=A0A267EJB9_9PLAT|nr:hypothetical protein BOX15_Mlig001578g1 [Macrostomum lignano]